MSQEEEPSPASFLSGVTRCFVCGLEVPNVILQQHINHCLDQQQLEEQQQQQQQQRSEHQPPQINPSPEALPDPEAALAELRRLVDAHYPPVEDPLFLDRAGPPLARSLPSPPSPLPPFPDLNINDLADPSMSESVEDPRLFMRSFSLQSELRRSHSRRHHSPSDWLAGAEHRAADVEQQAVGNPGVLHVSVGSLLVLADSAATLRVGDVLRIEAKFEGESESRELCIDGSNTTEVDGQRTVVLHVRFGAFFGFPVHEFYGPTPVAVSVWRRRRGPLADECLSQYETRLSHAVESGAHHLKQLEEAYADKERFPESLFDVDCVRNQRTAPVPEAVLASVADDEAPLPWGWRRMSPSVCAYVDVNFFSAHHMRHGVPFPHLKSKRPSRRRSFVMQDALDEDVSFATFIRRRRQRRRRRASAARRSGSALRFEPDVIPSIDGLAPPFDRHFQSGDGDGSSSEVQRAGSDEPEEPIVAPVHVALCIGDPKLVRIMLEEQSDAFILQAHPIASQLGALAGHLNVLPDSAQLPGREADLVRFAALGSRIHTHAAVVLMALANAFMSLDVVDPEGRSPLHVLCAAPDDAEDMAVSLVCCQSVDLLRRDKSGDTPLLVAIRHGNVECARALLKVNPLCLNVAAADGRTPMEVAAAQGSDAMVALLREFQITDEADDAAQEMKKKKVKERGEGKASDVGKEMVSALDAEFECSSGAGDVAGFHEEEKEEDWTDIARRLVQEFGDGGNDCAPQAGAEHGPPTQVACRNRGCPNKTVTRAAHEMTFECERCGHVSCCVCGRQLLQPQEHACAAPHDDLAAFHSAAAQAYRARTGEKNDLLRVAHALALQPRFAKSDIHGAILAISAAQDLACVEAAVVRLRSILNKPEPKPKPT